MDRKYAYYIFLGLAIGPIFGVFWAANSNIGLGVLCSGLAGAGIGWFIAAARSLSQKEKDKPSKL